MNKHTFSILISHYFHIKKLKFNLFIVLYLLKNIVCLDPDIYLDSQNIELK
ncbi:MAG: hypothetical protein BAJALOKI1v1_1030004 [Promethearchaeota archaeon]|nr:MAG: hypothetical protein BAJALOKI1v1_1030004 [Candidatus Lokiarchaeota archaeon]